jgi:hypothetical protein
LPDMKYSIIGAGLVGNALHKQLPDSIIYDRTTSSNLPQQELDVLIVAAPTGSRISVNKDPIKDLEDCQQIINLLQQCRYNKLIYISTVDVYANKTSANADPELQQPSVSYGSNRWYLEQAMNRMPNIHITRIASLIDLSIDKNILYDLKDQVWLDKICLDSCIQWYPLKQLGIDVVRSITQKIRYQNLCSAPICNREIVQKFFPKLISQLDQNVVTPITYNVTNYDQNYSVPLDQIWKSFEEYFQ